MGEAKPQKLYILTLVFGTTQKQVYLSGDAGEDAEARFNEARRGLNPIGDQATEWTEFLYAALAHFADKGFSRVHK